MNHFAKTFFADTDKFYSYETETLSPYFYEKLEEVSPERRARVERVRNDAVKAELLAAELVRNYALKTVFGIENPEIEKTEFEKPYIKGAENCKAWEVKEWLLKLAIPEHALGWTFLVCPIAGFAVAGLATLIG